MNQRDNLKKGVGGSEILRRREFKWTQITLSIVSCKLDSNNALVSVLSHRRRARKLSTSSAQMSTSSLSSSSHLQLPSSSPLVDAEKGDRLLKS